MFLAAVLPRSHLLKGSALRGACARRSLLFTTPIISKQAGTVKSFSATATVASHDDYDTTWQASVNDLAKALKNLQGLPYCTGTVPLNSESSKLFYEGQISAQVIDFMNTTDEELSRLSLACQPASFGRNQEDVYDESYRKAGKLDVNHFATAFNPSESGIIDMAHELLFPSGNEERSIKAQLYKLNVYGPGSFFKSHVDTPRGDDMFGSLVVVLPTKHEGGSLVFRHKGQESVFDTASTISSKSTPHAAFVAFFSDVEHEVLDVKSGYRVTLTYNLYFAKPSSLSKPLLKFGVAPAKGDLLLGVKSALTKFLATPSLLPAGGLLAIRLSHKYPVSQSTNIADMETRLKGTDVMLKEACDKLSLETSLKLIYFPDFGKDYVEPVSFLLDSPLEDQEQYSALDDIRDSFIDLKDKCTVAYSFPDMYPEIYSSFTESKLVEDAVPMVTLNGAEDKSNPNRFPARYIAYGNESCLEYMYYDVYLVAKVKPFKERKPTLVAQKVQAQEA
ncbi:hypothetical protein D9613_009832 [Agrocybe pediades]|uniref:Fe2OG dioxygenase domain-containing protein n=1 Tax=Agrocybe pediades TaxID=84607 RepID=A0A8H4QXF8_9AGAR|nr:hypothetical protein D9613_009832 [Agrocybe pediades]